jgi:chitodextrinase
MKHRLWAALCVAILLGARSAAAPEPARGADEFVESIGFATHWGYPDTPYGYAYESVKRLLGESGVSHVRDGYHERLKDLYRTYGITATLICGPGQGSMEAILGTIKDNLALIDMIEGPNEVDIFPTSANYQGKTFPGGPIAFQNDLYAAIKGDPATRHLGVIAPSTARMDSNLKLAPLRSLDYTVMHSYAGGGPPESSLEGGYVSNMLNAGRILGAGAVLKPIVVTESGYHTALESGGGVIAGVQPGVSETAQAKYLPRHFAAYFNAGIPRTVVYEFINEFTNEATNAEASFGILRRDLTPKPAYHALRNLIGLLGEARWRAAAQRWERKPFRPRALDFTLDSPPDARKNLRHTLLQKSDGDFYLLLWQEIASFDTRNRRDIANPDAPVTLSLRTSIRRAAVYRVGGSAQPVQRWTNPKTLTLKVPDEVLVVRLTPVPPRDTRPPAPPKAITATATGDAITLSWDAPPDNDVRGYFVTRLGRYLGRTESRRFTDAGRLPATGYPYAVRSFDAAGNVSAPVPIIARTKNEVPDLVPTDLSWTPASPRPGDAVSFRVTIRNIGSGPTPSNVTHGIAFHVDGVFVSWSDAFNGPLAPGETRTLTANHGPQGSAVWTATPGRHTVTAHLDDVNRINEGNENNNERQAVIEVTP